MPIVSSTTAQPQPLGYTERLPHPIIEMPVCDRIMPRSMEGAPRRREPIQSLKILFLISLWGFLALADSGCGFLWVKEHVKKLAPHPPMLSATTPQLLAILQKEADAVKTLNARVELRVASGGPKSGVVTKYREVTAYLLVSKPNDIRLRGQFSILGLTIFDMASMGNQFELSIPELNKFYVGLNNVIPPKVKNPLERLRPQVILESLLINPVQGEQRVAPMNDRAESAAEYQLLVVQPKQAEVDQLVRRVIFSRYNLLPLEQIIYDSQGNPATQVTYSRYRRTQGVWLPWQILIVRPVEEYSIRLKISHLTLNQPLSPNSFMLQQPAGSKLIRLSRNRIPAARRGLASGMH